MTRWRDLSIAKKLYFVVGIMAVLIAGELLMLRFSMRTLSAVRAFVEAEGTWSKAQKNSVFSLQRYAFTHDEGDYQDFLEDLKIPEGDHQARIELMKPNPDLEVVRDGFLKGGVHREDLDPMISLLLRFNRVSYLARAIDYWGQGDVLLAQLRETGIGYHESLHNSGHSADNSLEKNPEKNEDALVHIRQINDKLTVLEAGFSGSLGEGSRWLEHVVITLLFIAVLMVESFGLTLTFRTSRQISKGLADLVDLAGRLGRGDFSRPLQVRSKDEIGSLTGSVNEMGSTLKESYRELEARVEARTAELEKFALENARLYEEAKDALRVRDEFMSIASHELKTPLSAVFLQLQLVLRYLQQDEEGFHEKALENSKKAIIQGEKLKNLVEDLLDLTRIRAGKMQLVKVECDLRRMMEEAITESLAVFSGIHDSKAEFRLEGPPELACRCDEMRISQVMTNLLSNAIKYGAGKSMEVRLQQLESQVEFRVRDHGIGVPADKHEFIFERFERVVGTGEISGLGLGLYISRQIVNAHGGTIRVTSKPGEGSEFTVTLPTSPQA